MQIRSAAFLHKYSAPTLLVLSEAEPTWAGRLRDKKDTMHVSAMSISVSEQKVSEIWEASELPSDAFCLLPVASGGALILCRHLIIFQAQVYHLTGCWQVTIFAIPLDEILLRSLLFENQATSLISHQVGFCCCLGYSRIRCDSSSGVLP